MCHGTYVCSESDVHMISILLVWSTGVGMMQYMTEMMQCKSFCCNV